MTEMVVTTGAIRLAKLQIVTTNKPTSSFLQAGCPSCRPTHIIRALKGRSTTLFVHVNTTAVLTAKKSARVNPA